MHYSGKAASRCIATHRLWAYLELRLSFGGSGCPPAWCTASEIVTDLANDLVHCSSWNPAACHSPAQHLVPAPECLPSDVPFGTALPLALEPPPCPEGKMDYFIDDVINAFLDTPENCARSAATVPLAIHILNCTILKAL